MQPDGLPSGGLSFSWNDAALVGVCAEVNACGKIMTPLKKGW
jgi:hypothetical protein